MKVLIIGVVGMVLLTGCFTISKAWSFKEEVLFYRSIDSLHKKALPAHLNYFVGFAGVDHVESEFIKSLNKNKKTILLVRVKIQGGGLEANIFSQSFDENWIVKTFSYREKAVREVSTQPIAGRELNNIYMNLVQASGTFDNARYYFLDSASYYFVYGDQNGVQGRCAVYAPLKVKPEISSLGCESQKMDSIVAAIEKVRRTALEATEED